METIGAELLKVAPGRWKTLAYTLIEAATVSEMDIIATFGNGSEQRIETPDALIDIFSDLRKRMYSPEKGIWYTATATLTADLQISIDFDYDHEPTWAWKTPAIVYVEDLQMYPRQDSTIPGWLRERLAEEGHPLPSSPAAPAPAPAPAPADATTTDATTTDVQDRISALHQSIAEHLHDNAPDGWAQITCTYRQAGGTVEALITATSPHGEQQVLPGVVDLFRALYALRDLMHTATPNAPLWLTATATLHRDGDLQLSFDSEHEPDWDEPVTPEHYAEDLRRWPRPAHTLPAWLTERLAQA